MDREQWRLRFIPAAALLLVVAFNLGTSCPIPGSKPKGMKVTGFKSLETIVVKTKEDSGFSFAEYTPIKLQGFESPSGHDAETIKLLGKTLTETLEGKYVVLEFDDPDKPFSLGTGEMPGYVFLDGKMVNEELIRQGLGRFSGRNSPKRYGERLKKAEDEAKEARRGMWANYSEERRGRDEEDYDRGGRGGNRAPEREDRGREVNNYEATDDYGNAAPSNDNNSDY